MSDVLDFFRTREPRFKDVPDDELTGFIGKQYPDFLKDEGFKKTFDDIGFEEPLKTERMEQAPEQRFDFSAQNPDEGFERPITPEEEQRLVTPLVVPQPSWREDVRDTFQQNVRDPLGLPTRLITAAGKATGVLSPDAPELPTIPEAAGGTLKLASDAAAGAVSRLVRGEGPGEIITQFGKGPEQLPAGDKESLLNVIPTEMARLAPALAATGGLGALGVPAPLAFGAPFAALTYGETGDPIAAMQSGGIAAVIPGVGGAGRAGGELMAQRAAAALRTGPVATRALEATGRLVGSQALMGGLLTATAAPEMVHLLKTDPEGYQRELTKIVAMNLAFEVPHLPANVRQVMAKDRVDQYTSSPEYKRNIDNMLATQQPPSGLGETARVVQKSARILPEASRTLAQVAVEQPKVEPVPVPKVEAVVEAVEPTTKPDQVSSELVVPPESEVLLTEPKQITDASKAVDAILAKAVADIEKPATGTLAENVGRMVTWGDFTGRLDLDEAGRPVIQTGRGLVELPANAETQSADLEITVMRRYAKIPEPKKPPGQKADAIETIPIPEETTTVPVQEAVMPSMAPELAQLVSSVLNVARDSKAALPLKYGALEAVPVSKRVVSGQIARMEQAGATDAQTAPLYDQLQQLEQFENEYQDVVTTPDKVRGKAKTSDIVKTQVVPVPETKPHSPAVTASSPVTVPDVKGDKQSAMDTRRREWIDETRKTNPTFAPDIESWKELLSPVELSEVNEWDALSYKSVAMQGGEKGYKPYKLTTQQKARLVELERKYRPRQQAEIGDPTPTASAAPPSPPIAEPRTSPPVAETVAQPAAAKVATPAAVEAKVAPVTDSKVEIRNHRIELKKLQGKLDREVSKMGSMRPPAITAELTRTISDKMAKVQDKIDALEKQESQATGRKPISELADADILKLAVSAGVGKTSKYFSDFQEAKSIRVRLQDLDDKGLLDRSVLVEPKPAATEGGVDAGALGEVGMGGAKPGEFVPSGATITGIKNARIDQQRAERGLEPIPKPETLTDKQVHAETMAKIDADPGWQDRVISELTDTPRAMTPVETVGMLHRITDLRNEHAKTTRELAEAYDEGRTEDVSRLNSIASDFGDQLSHLESITGRGGAGTESGRSLRWRRTLMADDFSLAQMEANKRAAKGGAPLTPQERVELVKAQAKIEATQKAYDDYVAKTDQRISVLEVAKAVSDLQRENLPRIHPKILEQAEKIVQKFESAANAAGARLREKLKTASSGVDPTILSDLIIIGTGKLARKGLEFAKWADEMVVDWGETIRPYLDDAWKASNAMMESTAQKAPRAVGDTVRKISKGETPEQKQVALKETISARIKEGDTAHLTPLVQKLARSFVEQGIRDREALIDAVHSVLKETNPELTRREAMDAISGYGDYKQLSKDQVSVELRGMKGEMQQLAKLEDITSRQPPLKTGVERRTPTDEERRLLKLVNEAKRKYGVVVTDPARQLKSALDSVKTRLKNQIADLEFQIASDEKIVKKKTGLQYDTEANTLKAERDALKTQFDEVFGKPEMTDEQRVRMAIGAVERSITDLEQRIKTGDVGPRSRASKTPQTPELEAAKARREALKGELQEMRELDAGWQSEQAAKKLESQKESLTESIAEMERKLATGDVATQARQVDRPAQPELEQLKQQRDVLSKRLRDARKKPAEQKAAEALDRRVADLNKRITEREKQIAEGDVSTTGAKLNRPLPPRIEEARQRLDELNEQIAELRRGPAKTPEQIALQSLKTRLKNRTAELQDKLAKGDFAPRAKRTVALDAEANRLKFENEKAKRAYYEGLFNDRMARRSVPAKFLGTGVEVLNTSRAVITSIDFSGLLRQGGFIAFAHPILAAKSLPAMFKAFRSERNQHAVDQEILSRENYPLYKASKLYLSERGHDLSKMEEAYMSRWADKIPMVAGSQRAYTTFLNKLRADSFDLMAKSLSKDGTMTPDQAKALSNFINVATGRGTFGAKDQVAVGFNTVFFAPRYVASRFQLLLGQPLMRGDAKTRKLIAKEYARFLIGIGAVYGLGALAGADFEWDPRSSNFGKMRFGNTRIDPLSGIAQITTLLGRLVSGQTKTTKGEILPIRGDKVRSGQGSWDFLGRFIRSKLSPAVGMGVDVVAGKDVVGQKVTPGSMIQKTMMPISFQGIYDAMKDMGVPKGAAVGLLSIFGMGVQTYDDKNAPQKPKQQWGGRVSD